MTSVTSDGALFQICLLVCRSTRAGRWSSPRPLCRRNRRIRRSGRRRRFRLRALRPDVSLLFSLRCQSGRDAPHAVAPRPDDGGAAAAVEELRVQVELRVGVGARRPTVPQVQGELHGHRAELTKETPKGTDRERFTIG